MSYNRISRWLPATLLCQTPLCLPSEKKQMHANVLQHEPDGALFVPEDDPLLFYTAILRSAKKH